MSWGSWIGGASDSLTRLLRKALHRLLAWRLPLLSIVFPISVRAIPELLAGPYPLGFDTVWVYAPFIKEVHSEGFGSALMDLGAARGAPLMYVLLAIPAIVFGGEPFLITKAAAPVLHGLLVFSMYYFVKRGLHWDENRCLLTVLLSSLYFLPLRLSWDMYKNTLGYALLILGLAHFPSNTEPGDRWKFLSMGGLSVLVSEVTGVLLGAVAGLYFLRDVAKRRKWNLDLLFITFAAVLAALVYAGLLLPAPPGPSPLGPAPRNAVFLFNYVGATEDVYFFPDIGDLYATVLSLSGMILGPLFPLAYLGYERVDRLRIWTAVLGVGAFSVLVFPFAAVPLWHRWLFLLTFPVLIFSVRGLSSVRPRFAAAFFAGVIVLSASFMVLPPEKAFPYYASPYTLPFVPSSLMQNSVPLQDSVAIVGNLRWLNEMGFANSVLVAHTAFFGWVRLYSNVGEMYDFVNPEQVNGGNFSRYQHVFLIYFSSQHPWFRASLVPDRMVKIHEEGKIAIYELV